LQSLVPHSRGLTAVVGTPWVESGRLVNAAAVLHHGRLAAFYAKQLLPNYGVFDEQRYFSPGHETLVVRRQGVAFGVTICEDIWYPGGPAEAAAAAGAQLVVNLSASPY